VVFRLARARRTRGMKLRVVSCVRHGKPADKTPTPATLGSAVTAPSGRRPTPTGRAVPHRPRSYGGIGYPIRGLPVNASRE
jgi:hypothetical protein